MQALVMSGSDTQHRWYRIPIVWMVIGIPLTSVVVTLSIVWISVKTFDGVVVDDYYRKGLEINRDLARDRYADSISLEAIANIADDRLRFELRGNTNGSWPDRLELGFYHPTVSNRDVLVTMLHDGSGHYSAASPSLAFGKWNVMTGTDTWRLKGTLFHPAEEGFSLKPIQSARVNW